MQSDTEKEANTITKGSIAPWWHTVLVLVILAVMSVASWYGHGLPNVYLPGISSRLSSYFTVLLLEWCVVLLIWLALKHQGLSISILISSRWKCLKDFFRDLGLAVGSLILIVPSVGIIAHLCGGEVSRDLGNIMPKSGFDLLVWIALAATAGFCEELIFRGYLTRQFGAWTRNSIFAIFLQGVVFGLSHGNYGKVMLAIMVEGWLLGLLAYWRKSLLPGMLAHVLQDGTNGVISFFS